MQLGRRELVLGLGAIPLIVASCGTVDGKSMLFIGDEGAEGLDSEGISEVSGEAGVVDAVIGANHSHALKVSKSEFELTIDIKGEAEHNHSVLLSLEDLIRVRDGLTLRKKSSMDGHSHVIVFHPSKEIAGEISENHGHSVGITSTEFFAEGEVELTLSTGNFHTHKLILTEDQLESVLKGAKVEVESSAEFGHAHKVTFN